jgi:hypothetical protein
VQTVCSAAHNLQCVIPMLQIDSVCTILILFVLTYNGRTTRRKIAGSIPDGVTNFSDPSYRWLVVSWTTTKWTITASLYKPATELPQIKMPPENLTMNKTNGFIMILREWSSGID